MKIGRCRTGGRELRCPGTARGLRLGNRRRHDVHGCRGRATETSRCSRWRRIRSPSRRSSSRRRRGAVRAPAAAPGAPATRTGSPASSSGDSAIPCRSCCPAPRTTPIRLTALMAKWVVDIGDRAGRRAHRDAIVMTHPANWTEYQLGMLRNALADVGLGEHRADLRAGGRGARLRRRGERRAGARPCSSTTSAAARSTSPCCGASGDAFEHADRTGRHRAARRHRLRRGGVPVRPGRTIPPTPVEAARSTPKGRRGHRPTCGGAASTPRRRCRRTSPATSR